MKLQMVNIGTLARVAIKTVLRLIRQIYSGFYLLLNHVVSLPDPLELHNMVLKK